MLQWATWGGDMCSPLPGDSLQGYVGSFSQLEGGGEGKEMQRIRASTESNSTGLISYKRAVIFQQWTWFFLTLVPCTVRWLSRDKEKKTLRNCEGISSSKCVYVNECECEHNVGVGWSIQENNGSAYIYEVVMPFSKKVQKSYWENRTILSRLKNMQGEMPKALKDTYTVQDTVHLQHDGIREHDGKVFLATALFVQFNVELAQCRSCGL